MKPIVHITLVLSLSVTGCPGCVQEIVETGPKVAGKKDASGAGGIGGSGGDMGTSDGAGSTGAAGSSAMGGNGAVTNDGGLDARAGGGDALADSGGGGAAGSGGSGGGGAAGSGGAGGNGATGGAAGAEPPRGGPNCSDEGERCPAVCDWFTDCIQNHDLCPGVSSDAESTPMVHDSCLEACSEADIFATTICEANSCEQAIGALSDQDPDFGEYCAGNGPEPPPPQACANANRLPMTAAGPFGPSARVTTMSVPSNRGDAEAAGCHLVGGNNGIGLAGFLNLMGQLDNFIQVDAEGNISLILFTHISGWPVGQPPNDGEDPRLNLYYGASGENGFSVERRSFENNNPDDSPRWSFGATIRACQLSSDRGPFELTIGGADLPLTLALSQVSFTGEVLAREDGFELNNGVLTGYLTIDALIAMVGNLQTFCAADNDSDFCGQAGQLLDGDPETLAQTLFLPILRGADALVLENVVRDDCGDDCNAVSVCMPFQARATPIVGVSPPN